MRIALCQINPTIGDFAGNCDRIEAAARDALAAGAQLAVFSEMCVMGYPARDLLERPAFLAAQDDAIARLRERLRGIAAVIGCVRRHESGAGKGLFNSAVLIEDGQITAIGDKCLLPTYDVFDEDRYFDRAARPVQAAFGGKRLGLTVCEDCWNDKDFWRQRHYAYDPVEELARGGVNVLVNISASPFSSGKQQTKEAMLAALARKHNLPLLYANQVGGNDDLIFDGRSLAFDATGRLLARGPAFAEGVTLVDLDAPPQTISPSLSTEDELHRALVLGTRDYARKCGFKTAVLGLSGGIDSALVAAIAAEAFGPQNVTGIALPSRFNAPESLTDARDLAQRLGLHFHVVPIEAMVGDFKHALAPLFAGRNEDVTEENMQARTRGVLLMALSNKFGHLLLTTGNKSELATGYCTLYGDMCGGLAVISDLYKTTVYTLSRYLNAIHPAHPPIPEACITKAPTAELRFNQKDQDTLPPYELLDDILKAAIEDQLNADAIIARGFDAPTVRRVMSMMNNTEYKRRQAPPGLKMTSKAFGTGRRIPIAQAFRA